MASKGDIAAYSVDELCDSLLDRLSERVVLRLREEKIAGVDFISLNNDQLKEIFPVMGERMTVSRIIEELKGNHKPQSSVGAHSAEIGN